MGDVTNWGEFEGSRDVFQRYQRARSMQLMRMKVMDLLRGIKTMVKLMIEKTVRALQEKENHRLLSTVRSM